MSLKLQTKRKITIKKQLVKKLREKQRREKVNNSRTSLWVFCQTLSPDFYKDDRQYLKDFCNTLQAFYEGRIINKKTKKKYTILIVEMPPRHGKTRTLTNFCSWIFGNSPLYKIIAAAYNDEYAQQFSKFTRNIIAEEHSASESLLFRDIFPNIKIKKDDKSQKQWTLEGSHFTFKGTGKGGGVTGAGGNMLIIDDLVKSADEAFNMNCLDKDWLWLTSTFLSRRDRGGLDKGSDPLLILCNTPWAKKDAGGRLREKNKGEYYLFKRPAYNDETGEMLCDEIMTYEQYKKLEELADEVIFAANYKLERIDVKGLLYGNAFKTYTDLPVDSEGKELCQDVRLQIDTADTGSDYFCGIFYRQYKEYFYVVDVIYTKAPVEETEQITAEMIIYYKCRNAKVEANAGGRPISVGIKRILENEYKWFGTIFDTPHQTKNKEARIQSNAGAVKEYIVMPVDWRTRWPEFYTAVTTYLREGKNKNDDAPDTLTAIVEISDKGKGHYFMRR